MRKNVFLLTLFSAVLILVFANSLWSQQRRMGFNSIVTTLTLPSPQEQNRMAQELGLSEDQRVEMKALTEKYKNEGKRLLEQYNHGYEAVVNLIEEPDPDSSQINDALKQFHQAHSQLVEKEVEYWMDIKEILTKEQNKEFWTLFLRSRVRGG